VFYCKDAFEGLSTMDALMDPQRRERSCSAAEDVVEGIAKREQLKAKARASPHRGNGAADRRATSRCRSAVPRREAHRGCRSPTCSSTST
jgi:cobalamin-dependent methionine synthase I